MIKYPYDNLTISAKLLKETKQKNIWLSFTRRGRQVRQNKNNVVRNISSNVISFWVSSFRVDEDNVQEANRITAGRSHDGSFVHSDVDHAVVDIHVVSPPDGQMQRVMKRYLSKYCDPLLKVLIPHWNYDTSKSPAIKTHKYYEQNITKIR